MSALMEKLPQFVLTLVLLIGFGAMVVTMAFTRALDSKNQALVEKVITGMGTACLLALGYWFGSAGK